MSGRLAGKTCLVTAAAKGMGRASALAFAREGARVHATDIDMDVLADLAEVEGITVARLDVTDQADVDKVIGALDRVDVLFNVGGWVHHGDVLTCGERDWDFSFDLNVKAMWRTARAVLPGMLERGSGSIINMASVAGSIAGIANRAAYGASKAAVIGLTKSIAIDYIRRGIRCNAMAPGTIQTPSLDDRINAFPDPVAARAAFIARQPIGRLGTAEELAAGAVFLASDESSYMTGQVLTMDGGITLCGQPPGQ